MSLGAHSPVTNPTEPHHKQLKHGAGSRPGRGPFSIKYSLVTAGLLPSSGPQHPHLVHGMITVPPWEDVLWTKRVDECRVCRTVLGT